MKTRPPCVLAFLALTGLASATVVNIDFNNSAGGATFSGLAAAPDPAGGATAIWNPLLNNVGTASSLDLNDSVGAATGIGFSLSGLSGSVSDAATEAERSAGFLALMRDYVHVDSANSSTVATATGTFTGLVVGASYDLYLYGQGQFMSTTSGFGGFRGQNSYFEVGGSGQQTGWDGVAGGNGFLVEGVEYVRFRTTALDGGVLGGVISFDLENVVPGGGGNIDPDAAPTSTGGGAQRGVINGLQLVAVPEPSVALLGAFGLLGLLLRRRP
jgi:hypothetical protein